MVIYRGDQDKNFNILTSPDLLAWQITQTINLPGGGECPEFFPLPLDGCEGNTKWVFIEANGRYCVGTFDGEKLEMEAEPLDSFGRYGLGCCYAGQIWSDTPDGRKIMLCWQQGDYQSVKFSQAMAIPVELSLKSFSDGMYLCAEPVKELKKIRDKSWEFTDVAIPLLNSIQDAFMDIPEGDLWDIELEMAKECEIIINVCGEDIALDSKLREVRISAARFSFPSDAKELKLRILVDRASIEIFGGNGRIWYAKNKLTTYSHPLRFPPLTSGVGSLKKVTIYSMNSIWGLK
jgi:fructan beta-fructosidase